MISPDPASAEKPRESQVLASVLMTVELLVVLAWKAWHLWPRVPLADPDTGAI